MKDGTVRIPNELFFANVFEQFDEGFDVRINLVGNSMRPTFLNMRDQVVLSRCNDLSLAALGRGDVVLFRRSDGHICLHRIIRRDGDTFYIRGDGNVGPFEVAVGGDIMARVVSGTFRGGKPFVTGDRQWERNTRRVMRFYPVKFVYMKVRHACGVVVRHLFKNLYPAAKHFDYK